MAALVRPHRSRTSMNAAPVAIGATPSRGTAMGRPSPNHPPLRSASLSADSAAEALVWRVAGDHTVCQGRRLVLDIEPAALQRYAGASAQRISRHFAVH